MDCSHLSPARGAHHPHLSSSRPGARAARLEGDPQRKILRQAYHGPWPPLPQTLFQRAREPICSTGQATTDGVGGLVGSSNRGSAPANVREGGIVRRKRSAATALRSLVFPVVILIFAIASYVSNARVRVRYRFLQQPQIGCRICRRKHIGAVKSWRCQQQLGHETGVLFACTRRRGRRSRRVLILLISPTSSNSCRCDGRIFSSLLLTRQRAS